MVFLATAFSVFIAVAFLVYYLFAGVFVGLWFQFGTYQWSLQTSRPELLSIFLFIVADIMGAILNRRSNWYSWWFPCWPCCTWIESTVCMWLYMPGLFQDASLLDCWHIRSIICRIGRIGFAVIKYLYGCKYVSVRIWTSLYLNVCIYIYMLMYWRYIRMYVRMYVCMYVCIYVCMYVCMYVCVPISCLVSPSRIGIYLICDYYNFLLSICMYVYVIMVLLF